MTTITSDSRALLEAIGLHPVINAMGAASRLGGSIISAEVRAAMDAAAQHCIPLVEMQALASTVIAEVTGAEAGCVSSGAAACLFLAAAACMAGTDLAAIDRLPDTTGLRNEVVLHRAHRNSYDHAIRATGARLVEFGYLGQVSGAGAMRWQLEAALTPATAAIYYFPGVTDLVLDLAEVTRIARRHQVPVIVDGSGVGAVAQLRRYIEIGVDLVAVSGGKSVGGPAGTGFLAGRRDLIVSATLQQQDMFVHPDLWSGPDGRGSGDMVEPPHQGIGRTMKVGREEVAGLLVALRRYGQADPVADEAHWSQLCDRIRTSLPVAVGVDAVTVRADGAMPIVLLSMRSATHARRVARELEAGSPRIFVGSIRLDHAELSIAPSCLRDDEVEVLIGRLCEVLQDTEDLL